MTLKRGYIRSSKAWYHNVVHKTSIMVGLYGTEGGTQGEFEIVWEELWGELTPKLYCFEDAWYVLYHQFPDLLHAMAENDSQMLSEEQFVQLLDSLGVVDMTEYEIPKELERTNEIVEKNELIGNFMKNLEGYETHKFRGTKLYNNPNCVEAVERTFLNYHNSWNWLMPVVIEIAIFIEDYGLNKHNSEEIEKTLELFTNFNFIVGGPENIFNDLYNGVIDFITWYNKNY